MSRKKKPCQSCHYKSSPPWTPSYLSAYSSAPKFCSISDAIWKPSCPRASSACSPISPAFWSRSNRMTTTRRYPRAWSPISWPPMKRTDLKMRSLRSTTYSKTQKFVHAPPKLFNFLFRKMNPEAHRLHLVITQKMNVLRLWNFFRNKEGLFSIIAKFFIIT